MSGFFAVRREVLLEAAPRLSAVGYKILLDIVASVPRPLKTAEVVTTKLHKVGAGYDYKTDVINNLDGSGGLIKDHGDVTNDAITYAFASAVART